ncbi:DUF4214 domain-containing protein [Blastococcus sp. CT_GayMR20]|uniref:DUF4214 domain-containing protein n=1 Tax=Blastococcus sp. CT_GayMR20 TaxID=2559609 RepID=UPI001073828C|nr:DUF4214 domain-containing protein [Blastococcus sp. CT_GayMR20]TFV85685.1 DUF4214 domain-containing protein [Blastococcus sp. CT_GayMR20]
MRRFATGSLAFLSLTGTILVLPVYAAPLPEAHPVETSIAEVALGSVVDPVGDAVVGIDGEVLPDGLDGRDGPAAAPSPSGSSAPAPSTPAPTASAPATTGPSESESTATPEPGTSAPTTPAAPTTSSAPAPSTTPAPSAAPSSSEEPTDEDVVVSGDEVPGVPALTVSQPSTEPFSSVGVTWQADSEITDVVAQIRVKRPSGRWSGWTTLEADDAEQVAPPGSADAVVRAGTAPYWTDDARGIEVVVQGARGDVPEDVRVALIDPGESAADSAPAVASAAQDQANAAVAMPPIVSRAAWGADPNLMQWTPQYAPTIKAATIHHTADSNNYSAEQVPAIMRSIYAYHSQTRDWGDIGYNVIVDKFGRIFEGRAGGLASTVIGAHAGGFNTNTFGVSMLGNYDLVGVPQATINAIADVIAWKFSLYNVDPAGSTVLTSAGGGTSRYAAGQQVALPTIFGHRDVGSTACPGKYGYVKLPEIRAGVIARSGAEPFVRGLYQDMMGRAPDTVGLQGWVSTLAATNGDRRAVVRGFSYSYEYRLLAIRQAYQTVFNREVDPGGISTWMRALQNGSLRIDQLGPVLMTSAEFYLRGGSSDAGFVDNIYRAALGRPVDPSEVGLWAWVRQTMGPGAVIDGVWGSFEASMRRVNKDYTYYLGRPASVAEQRAWAPALQAKGDEAVREEIIISWEYFVRSRVRFP